MAVLGQEEKRMKKKKWTEPQTPVEHQQEYQQLHNGNARRREEKEAERVFEEIVACIFLER